MSWVAPALLLPILPGPGSKGTADTLERERRLLTATPAVVSSPPPVPRVWSVDRSESSEQYSNGLRVELAFSVRNRPRDQFPIYSLAGAADAGRTGTSPVGIVYHTTESHLAQFEEDQNRRLKQLGRNLLEVIRHDRSYHYVIDRFGRVFRVVEETDAANHAGNSVWADGGGVYVNLNDSFLGVAFEAQTGEVDQVTPAQIASARQLTQMLRSRYQIPAENCVTHAQVSVNPLNMKIGAHTDWAAGFPFAELDLPDNYAVPVPSLYVFGFSYDDVFLNAAGKPWRGLDLASDQLERQAQANGLSAAGYRRILQHRYKDIEAALKEKEQSQREQRS